LISDAYIPSISTGIYHYPLAAAADVAVEVAQQFDHDSLEVIFACFDDISLRVYRLRLEQNWDEHD
jgi:O-acetyl-ADP-ribose deacetylase (regulator of RNase III)